MINTEEETLENFLKYDFVKLAGKVPTLHRFKSKPFINHHLHDLAAIYNEIYIQYIVKMFRHIGRLEAWNLLLNHYEIEKNLKIELNWDYIEPLLAESSDLPLAFKDLTYTSIFKLKLIASKGIDGMIKVKELEQGGKRSSYYRDKIKNIIVGNQELEAKVLNISRNIYSSELQDLHGKRHHDIFPSLNCTIPSVEYSVNDGIVCLRSTFLKERDLDDELELIKGQYTNVIKLYDCWWTYTKDLINLQFAE